MSDDAPSESPPPGTARPAEPGYHHGNLKEALIEAGLAALEREGLAGVSLRGLAAEVGVSHTAPKNHFGSLRGLLTALATRGFEKHAAHMRAGVGTASTREARLQAALSGYVAFAEAHPALFQLMFSPAFCDLDDEGLQAAGRQSYDVLRGISQGLDWPGRAGPDDALRTEMMLWSFAHGYATLMIGRQFQTGPEGSALHPPRMVFPRFGYRD